MFVKSVDIWIILEIQPTTSGPLGSFHSNRENGLYLNSYNIDTWHDDDYHTFHMLSLNFHPR